MNYTIYPTGENTRYSSWNATGEYYSKNINIEHFANADNSAPALTYQEFLYSIVVYFYRIDQDSGRQTLKTIKSVEMINTKKEKIPLLDYSNGTVYDKKCKFAITVVDLTSYIPRQPMLKLKYFINQGEIVENINFMYPNPTDPIMREYTMELKPFDDINFVFDLENMI